MQKVKNGFTVIEMLVVIVIIGILASLATFAYRGWQTGIDQRQVQSDLRLAGAAMEAAKNFGTGYPLQLPGTFEIGDGIAVDYTWGDSTRYCIQGSSKRMPSILYNIVNGSSSSPQSGACSAAPFPPAAPSPSAVASSSSAITVSWANVTNATSYAVRYGTGSPTTLAGCTSSPCSLTGLSSSTTYNISVVATNATGSSAAGTTSATTLTLPGTPSPSAIGLSTSSINVTWANVANATSYAVNYGTGSPSTTAGCTSSPCSLTGLSSSTTYYVNVIASNANGSTSSATVNATTCGSASYRLIRSGLPAAQGNFFTLSYRITAGGANINFPGTYPTPGTGPYTFDQTMTALCPATGYNYTLFYRDNLGSILTTFTGTFTTP